MARVLLGVTGSVAALKTPDLVRGFLQRGHEVRVVATRAAQYFFDPDTLPPGTLVTDDDEWPGAAEGQRYQRGDEVLHIELRRWAERLVIAPLDANTLAKLAMGLSDNCLSCVYRAWDPARPVWLAPAMNTLMWEHPLTMRHLRELAHLVGILSYRGNDKDKLIHAINHAGGFLRILPPIHKTLACGDTGVGAMAEVSTVLDAVG